MEEITKLAKKYKFSENQIHRFVTGRVIGNSWAKISDSEKLEKYKDDSTEKDKENEKNLMIKSLSKNEDFLNLVHLKKKELGIVESSIEEAKLIEKLESIINGEAQGTTLKKVQTKKFLGQGKMETQEEWIEVPSFPSVTDVLRATKELHSITQLDAKTKAKFEIENEKWKSEQGNLIEKFAEINKMAEEAIKMEDKESIEITMDDYDLEELEDGEKIEIDKDDILEI